MQEVIRKLDKNDKLILEILADYDEYVLNFKRLSYDANMKLSLVKRACRKLAKLELAELTTAFSEEDMMVMGKGYMVTSKGMTVDKILKGDV